MPENTWLQKLIAFPVMVAVYVIGALFIGGAIALAQSYRLACWIFRKRIN